jgi:predicted enzyme related to lactoylglutathione lyase
MLMKTTTVRSWNLNARNLAESLAFYRDLLGAQVKQEHQVQGVDVARVDLGGFSIGLFDASEGDRPNVPHHTVGIEGPDDPEELKREIEAKGVTVDHIRVHSEREGGGYSIYVNDPSGNRLELSKSGR